MNEKLEINDEFLLGQGQKVYQNAKTAHELLTERMAKDMSQYDGEFTKEERAWSNFLGTNRLFINKTYTNTQRIVVDVVETFFDDPEEIVDVASWKSVPYENKQIVKALMNYRLNSHPINFYQELYEMAVNAVRNIMCVVKIYPRLKVATEKTEETIETETGTITEEREEQRIVAFEPAMECVPPEHVYFSRRATWKDYYKHPMVHKYKRTRDELNQMGYKNVDTVSSAMDTKSGDDVTTQRHAHFDSPFSDETNVREQEEVWVYEVWDFLPGKDGFLESGSYIGLGDEHNMTVIGRGWQRNELPYRFSEFENNRPPFVLGEAYPEPHRLEGKSFPWITESNQKEVNAVANQEREAYARYLRPNTYINRDANVDLAAVVQRRIGGYVQGDGPVGNAIGEVGMQTPLGVAGTARARVDADYWDAGIPPNLLGSGSGEESATGANQQLVNANKKLALVIKNIAYTAVLPAMSYLLRLEQTYETDAFIKMVTGRVLGWALSDDNMPPRSVIQGDFDLKINLGTNKQAQLNKIFLLMDRANQANQVIGQLVQMGVVNPKQVSFKDPMKILEEAMKIMGFKEVSEFNVQALPSPGPGQAPGIASQPRNVADPQSQIGQTSPGAPGALDVVS